MKFLLDECLSHTYTALMAELGFPDTLHPVHIGLRRLRDDQVAARALADDRVLISAISASCWRLPRFILGRSWWKVSAWSRRGSRSAWRWTSFAILAN